MEHITEPYLMYSYFLPNNETLETCWRINTRTDVTLLSLDTPNVINTYWVLVFMVGFCGRMRND